MAPADAEFLVVVGGIHLNRAAQAKLFFARALAQAAGHLRALHGLGTALLCEGKFEDAAQRFQRILALEPSHPRAGLDFAHCQLELGLSTTRLSRSAQAWRPCLSSTAKR